jgi:ABC-type transport system involved in multi-copper enzyme maturation permease subunit
MRPYLAIIRDAFHEALVSRVLWILLVVMTLFLGALAPLGFIEQAGSRLTDEDFLNQDKLIEKIIAQDASSAPSPGRRIWRLMDDATRQSLKQKPKDPFAARARFRTLERSLQTMIERRDFYVKDDWAAVKLPASAKALLAKGLSDLPADQVARFSRLALEAAFPDEIAPAPSKQVQLAYFNWELGLPLPVEPEQLFPAINQVTIIALDVLLGVAGVFVAVLVTASMIPQTFEAGSVDLLLSKPVYRAGLFLSKFVGGCAFIAINATYFIGGLWLILGARFGLWNQRLLLAIPLYLFLFAIYYAVSSLAGVVWRNAIVSVVMAVVFWAVCWALGAANQLVEGLALNPRRIVTIVPAGDDLVTVNSQNDVFRWDKSESDWQKIFIARADNQFPFNFGSSLAGPIYDATDRRILAFKVAPPGFAPLQTANHLLIGKADNEWRRSEGINVPEGASALFTGPHGGVLTVSSQGVFRLEGNLETKQQDINVFGLHIPLPDQGGRFAKTGPTIYLRPLLSAAIHPRTGTIALFDGYRLLLLERHSDGTYRLTNETSFKRKQRGLVALAGDRVLLVQEGQIQPYDLQLKSLEPIPTRSIAAPRSSAVSSDGRYVAVVFRDGQLWMYDTSGHAIVQSPVVGQGDVSAVAFDGSKLLVADRLTRLSRYELGAWRLVEQQRGSTPLAEKIYRYALHPLYTIFPKPSQLSQTVMYALTPRDDAAAGTIRINDGENGPEKLDVWGPVWSNLAFLVVVLAIASVYISRKDF